MITLREIPGVDMRADFHTLSSAAVCRLLEAADKDKYRAPRPTRRNASRACYYYAALQRKARARLEYLRRELREECISLDELGELESLIPFIDPGDLELLEAAGVPEFK